jgi:hypothetical protein
MQIIEIMGDEAVCNSKLARKISSKNLVNLYAIEIRDRSEVGQYECIICRRFLDKSMLKRFC